MATRLYFSRTTQTTVQTSIDYSAQFSANFSSFNHYWLTSTASDSGMTTLADVMNTSTNPDNWAYGIWYSPPMASTHSDWSNGVSTFTFVMRFAESNSLMNAFYKIGIYIVNNAATSVVSDGFFTGGIELNVTTLQSRRISAATNAFDPVTNSVGDRLMIIMGINKASTRTADTASMSIGANAATDLTDGNTDTDADNPWLEVSQTITWGSESTGFNGLMMMGCGT